MMISLKDIIQAEGVVFLKGYQNNISITQLSSPALWQTFKSNHWYQQISSDTNSSIHLRRNSVTKKTDSFELKLSK